MVFLCILYIASLSWIHAIFASMLVLICTLLFFPRLCLNELMESKGGKKKSSSRTFYEAPLGYSIEDVRPHGGIKKFKSAAYSNVRFILFFH